MGSSRHIKLVKKNTTGVVCANKEDKTPWTISYHKYLEMVEKFDPKIVAIKLFINADIFSELGVITRYHLKKLNESGLAGFDTEKIKMLYREIK